MNILLDEYIHAIGRCFSDRLKSHFFWLVALPEAIAKLRGGTLQSSFPAGARHNDYIRGSMLIIGWFGNFLLLVLALAVVAIVLLIAL